MLVRLLEQDVGNAQLRRMRGGTQATRTGADYGNLVFLGHGDAFPLDVPAGVRKCTFRPLNPHSVRNDR